MKYIIGNVIHR